MLSLQQEISRVLNKCGGLILLTEPGRRILQRFVCFGLFLPLCVFSQQEKITVALLRKGGKLHEIWLEWTGNGHQNNIHSIQNKIWHRFQRARVASSVYKETVTNKIITRIQTRESKVGVDHIV